MSRGSGDIPRGCVWDTVYLMPFFKAYPRGLGYRFWNLIPEVWDTVFGTLSPRSGIPSLVPYPRGLGYRF